MKQSLGEMLDDDKTSVRFKGMAKLFGYTSIFTYLGLQTIGFGIGVESALKTDPKTSGGVVQYIDENFNVPQKLLWATFRYAHRLNSIYQK